MKVGLLKDTDKMTLEQLYKTKINWTNKIDKIKKYQTRFEEKGQTNHWLYKKNRGWIMEASKYLEKLNQIIQIREMKLP